MRRLIRFAVSLYPACWRARYGIEFDALLEKIDLGWRDLFDVLKGAAAMQIRHVGMILVGFAVCGALVAGLVSHRVPETYVSSASVHMEQAWVEEPSRDADAVRTDVAKFVYRALTQDSLAAVIKNERLYDYKGERDVRSLNGLAKRMRLATTIQFSPVNTAANWASTSFTIAFADEDRARAHRVVQDLIGIIMKASLAEAQQRATRFQKIQVLDPPTLPTLPTNPNHLLVTGFGCAIGLLVGMVVACLRRGVLPRAA